MTIKRSTIAFTSAGLTHGMSAGNFRSFSISRLELIILFSNKTFSTPSNRCKHEEKHVKKKAQ